MFGIDMSQWIMTIGFIGIVGIIFAETGLFLGFFLPGDSLLFISGFLASQHFFNIYWLVLAVILAAFLGYGVGYWFGRRLGGWLSRQKERWYFKKHYLNDAHIFYEKHGGKALLLSRLVPVVRTFVPIVAGMGHMSLLRYTLYNFLGALLWGGGVTLLGYYLGASMPDAQHYILPISLGIIVLSILPGIWHFYRHRTGPRSSREES